MLPAPQALPVQRVQQVLPAQQDLLVQQVLPAPQVLQVLQAQQDLPVPRVLPDLRVPPARPERCCPANW